METRILAGRSILVVEDEIRDALDLQDSFADAGARVFTAYRMQRAMEHAEHTSLSAAVIDISRGGGHPAALCRHLAKRRVPFAFYGRHIPAELREWAHVPLLAKPAAVNSALDVVARLLYLSDAAPATIGRAQRNAVDCGGIRPD